MPKPQLFGDKGLAIFAGQDASNREQLEVLISALLRLKQEDYAAAEQLILDAMQNVTEQQAVINLLREKNASRAVCLLKELGFWMSLDNVEGDEDDD